MNEREELRGRVLEVAYERALEQGGIEQAFFMGGEIAKELNADRNQTRDALTSLKANGLLEVAQAFYGGQEALRITRAGFRAVERLRDEGYKPTGSEDIRASGSIHVTFNGDVYGSAIQGAGSTAHITQSINTRDRELLEVLRELRDSIDQIENAERRSQALEAVEVLEEEVEADDTNPRAIRRAAAKMAHAVKDYAGPLNLLVTFGEKSGLFQQVGDLL